MLIRDITLFGDPATFSIALRKDQKIGEQGIAFAGVSFCVMGRWLGDIDAVSAGALILSMLDTISDAIRKRLEEFLSGSPTASAPSANATSSDMVAAYIEISPAIPGLKGFLGADHMVLSELGSRYRIEWDCESMDHSDYIAFATPYTEGLRVDLVEKSGDVKKNTFGFISFSDFICVLAEAAGYVREQPHKSKISTSVTPDRAD